MKRLLRPGSDGLKTRPRVQASVPGDALTEEDKADIRSKVERALVSTDGEGKSRRRGVRSKMGARVTEMKLAGFGLWAGIESRGEGNRESCPRWS